MLTENTAGPPLYAANRKAYTEVKRCPVRQPGRLEGEAIMIHLLGRETIYRDEGYNSFPNMACLADGTVICAFRHAVDRQKEYGHITHVDPTARDVYVVSKDGGRTFEPELHTIAQDENISYQDPCITVLSDGRVIVTYFRWFLTEKGNGAALWGEEMFRDRGRVLFDKYDCISGGAGCAISDDCGKTWRRFQEIRMEPKGPNGPVRGNIMEMPEGYLLMPVYGARKPGELSRSFVLRSDDRGESWYFYADAASDPENKNFLEPNLFLTESGRLLMLIRTQCDWTHGVDFEASYLDLHVVESRDGGKTWGAVRDIKGLWGSSPFHAYRLKSGNVLVAYGYRRAPFGIRAKLCNAELTDLETAPELVLVDDAPNGDLGYPHILQREDGVILVSYYVSGADGIRYIEASLLEET